MKGFQFLDVQNQNVLESKDLKDIVNIFNEDSIFNADPKVLKEYQKHLKKAMFIISLNLAENQLAHIKSCKRPVDVWKTFCKIHETKN